MEEFAVAGDMDGKASLLCRVSCVALSCEGYSLCGMEAGGIVNLDFLGLPL